MQNIIINNTELAIKEFNGQRVITFKDIDITHNRQKGKGNYMQKNMNGLKSLYGEWVQDASDMEDAIKADKKLQNYIKSELRITGKRYIELEELVSEYAVKCQLQGYMGGFITAAKLIGMPVDQAVTIASKEDAA